MRRPAYESEPQVSFLTQVLDEVSHGLIRVPRFQRPFVWTDEQRLELFRSVIEGTPIGSIMVWRTTREVPCFDRLGPHRLPNAKQGAQPRTYLLDGHQRLATLFAALYPPEPLEYDEDHDALAGWKVYYDLIAQDFRLGTITPLDRWLMPLSVVLDTRRHFNFLRQLADGSGVPPPVKVDTLVDRGDGIAKSVREYKIPIIPVVSDDLESVTRTFQRINSQGTPMSDVHMVAALSFNDGFDLGSRFAEIQALVRERGWETDDRTVLQVFKVVAGLDLYDAPVEDVAAKLKRGRAAFLDSVVDLLVLVGDLLRAWDVPSPELVPYAHQQVLLAVAAHASTNGVSGDLARKLNHWFWLSSFGGAANTSRVQAEQRRVLGLVHGHHPDFGDLRPVHLPWRFDFRHARIKAFLHVLASANPRGADGAAFRTEDLLSRYGSRAMGRIVTERERRSMKKETGPLTSGPENVLIAPPEQLSAVRRKLREEPDEAWLASHLVTPPAARALREGDYAAFLEIRAGTIQAWEQNFIGQMGGGEYRMRPAVLPGDVRHESP